MMYDEASRDILMDIKRALAIKLVNRSMLPTPQNQDVACLVFDRGVDAVVMCYTVDELIDML